MRKTQRNPNRGVVLALADAAAIHRMWELRDRDRRFFNPIEAYEATRAERDAMLKLEQKLLSIFTAHGVREQEISDR